LISGRVQSDARNRRVDAIRMIVRDEPPFTLVMFGGLVGGQIVHLHIHRPRDLTSLLPSLRWAEAHYLLRRLVYGVAKPKAELDAYPWPQVAADVHNAVSAVDLRYLSP
jgi:hypothetical protein